MKTVSKKRQPVTITVTPHRTTVHDAPPARDNGQENDMPLPYKVLCIAIGLFIGYLLYGNQP